MRKSRILGREIKKKNIQREREKLGKGGSAVSLVIVCQYRGKCLEELLWNE